MRTRFPVKLELMVPRTRYNFTNRLLRPKKVDGPKCGATIVLRRRRSVSEITRLRSSVPFGKGGLPGCPILANVIFKSAMWGGDARYPNGTGGEMYFAQILFDSSKRFSLKPVSQNINSGDEEVNSPTKLHTMRGLALSPAIRKTYTQ